MIVYSVLPFVIAAIVFAVAFAMRKRMTKIAEHTYARLGGEEGDAATRAARQGDIGPLRALLASLPASEHDARALYLDLAARPAPVAALHAWTIHEPTDATAHLALGVGLIGQAWRARGSGSSGSVSVQQAREFARNLHEAEVALARAAELAPADPTPWAMQLVCARGLSRPREHAEGMYAQAIARDASSWCAHDQMLAYLTQKWHGSHDAMFAFARDLSARLPVGDDLHTLVIAAHIERWMSLRLFENDERGARRYVADAAVRAECVQAYARGLGSPALRSRPSTIHAHNVAGMWFFLARDKPRLRAEIGRIGNAVTDYPWHSLVHPAEEAYAEATQWAYGI